MMPLSLIHAARMYSMLSNFDTKILSAVFFEPYSILDYFVLLLLEQNSIHCSENAVQVEYIYFFFSLFYICVESH